MKTGKNFFLIVTGIFIFLAILYSYPFLLPGEDVLEATTTSTTSTSTSLLTTLTVIPTTSTTLSYEEEEETYPEHPELEDDQQGLGMFFQFGWAPSLYNEVSQYYGFGGQYVGLIPTLDEDITGFGMYHVSLSGRVQSLEDRHSETAVELFHKFQITPFLSLKPDFQYIVNPGGDGRDALVAGIRMEMTF